MKNKFKYIDLLLMFVWVIIGSGQVLERNYSGAFITGCLLMFSTAHYFYLKIVEKLNQNK